MPLWSRLRNVFRTRGGDMNTELDEELQAHIAMRADQFVEEGLPPDEARRRAEQMFGNTLLVRERTRDADVAQWLDALLQDLRYALRMMRHSPVLTGVVVLSLGLGIGANTAFFTLTNALLLKQLPVRDPARLVSLELGRPGEANWGDSFTNPLWEEFDKGQDIASGAFAYAAQSFNAGERGETRMINAAIASGRVFETLGVEPVAGRLFTAADDRRGGGWDGPVAVLGYDYWQRAYGMDPSIVGRNISLDGKPYKVVGIAPASFYGIYVGLRFDVIVPLATETYRTSDPKLLDARSNWMVSIVARLKPEWTQARANERLKALAPGLFEATVPPNWPPKRVQDFLSSRLRVTAAARGLSAVSDSMRSAVLLLNGFVALVLLIACANVANLLLARATVRAREYTVRMALGASRSRLLRQSLTESLLLALAGAAVGLAIAQPAAQALVAISGRSTAQMSLDLAPDGRVLLFTTVVGVFCGLLFGMAPAWRASRNALLPRIAGTAGDGKGRLRACLVSLQVALSVVVLVGCGLFLSSWQKLGKASLGFDPNHVVLAKVDLSTLTMEQDQRAEAVEDVRRQLRGAPGVEETSASVLTPMGSGMWSSLVVGDDGKGGRREHEIYYNAVSPGFFRALGTPLLAGRDIEPNDRKSSTQVAVVNESFVRQVFGGGNPIGRYFEEGLTPSKTGFVTHKVQVVGIARDATYRELRQAPPPTMYRPLSQARALPYVTFAVRGAGEMEQLLSTVRAAFASSGNRFSYTLQTYPMRMRDAMVTERLLAALSTLFGALALGLAGMGLYGVLAYSVTRRSGEIGIRMALGATASHIRNWVLRQSGLTVLSGFAAGLLLALWLAPVAKKLLFGVKASDWRVYAVSLAVLVAISFAASYLPARRATRLNPVQALRHD
ncbi:ABC transporter permease [Paludibaculum fermentans]|uniref:ABC transporter permease n=1 Tax=Paludibaculum fermentans TaxID=1473598 RepID=A0A7S7NWP6_PALFE|nr:ABC transporter permease [Paludibaculum fermentans]QOY91190.1 ABC transporter permease [Paludibaculum fermentans]